MDRDFLIRSIDTLTITIADYNGRPYVEIGRSNLKGKPASVMFAVGDEPAALGFLSQLAEMFGVTLVVPCKKENEQ